MVAKTKLTRQLKRERETRAKNYTNRYSLIAPEGHDIRLYCAECHKQLQPVDMGWSHLPKELFAMQDIFSNCEKHPTAGFYFLVVKTKEAQA